ncbi:MAG: hypothetical protein AB7V13_06935 [Pseudorhodoplanes sp.]
MAGLLLGVSASLDIGAAFDQFRKRLGFAKQNAIIRHFLLVGFECLERLGIGNDFQFARDSLDVVNLVSAARAASHPLADRMPTPSMSAHPEKSLENFPRLKPRLNGNFSLGSFRTDLKIDLISGC